MSQTGTFGYSFNDSSQCAGGAHSVNTQELTRQQDVHKIWDWNYKSLIGMQQKRHSREPMNCLLIDSYSEVPKM